MHPAWAYGAYGSTLVKKRCRFFAPSAPSAAPLLLRLALAPLRTPFHSDARAAAVGRAGRGRGVPNAYSAYRAYSHRKRCRFFAPSPPTTAPLLLRLAPAPLRTPFHSDARAAAVGRAGRGRGAPNAHSAYRAYLHRKRCRFLLPSMVRAAPVLLRLALAPLRTPFHSDARAATVGRAGRGRHVMGPCVSFRPQTFIIIHG